ncbi:MAG: PilZ domain-containing protein [Planctomycetota bacterium]|nr:PilZ domain-containing protein [Planctomycetota bacterium]
MTWSLDQTQPADESGAYEPLRFERRQCDRWGLNGVATAFELAGDGFGRMHTLRMVDYSEGGLGAVSDSVIPLGAAVSVGFQSPGYPAKRGVILRCTPCGDGYRVAIGFEQRMAA